MIRKALALLACLTAFTACATMRFDPKMILTIADPKTVDMNLITAGTTDFVNIFNSEGMPFIQVTSATYSNDNKKSLITSAYATLQSNWNFSVGDGNFYGSLNKGTVVLQNSNFDYNIFTQSTGSNIFTELYSPANLPKKWLVCRAFRLVNFNREKIILDYRVALDENSNLSPDSNEIASFKKQAIEYFEKLVVLGVTPKYKAEPDLATRYFGQFVGEAVPAERFIEISL